MGAIENTLAHLPGLNKAKKNGFFTFRGFPHLKVRRLSNITATKETTSIPVSRNWGCGGQAPTAACWPIFLETPPLFPALSFFCNTCKRRNIEHKNTIHSYIHNTMPQIVMELVRVPRNTGVWRARFELASGSGQSGLAILPLLQIIGEGGTRGFSALQLLPPIQTQYMQPGVRGRGWSRAPCP